MINEDFLSEEYADSLGRLWRSEERKILSRIAEARDSPLARAIASDLEGCALDTPCVDGCQYDTGLHCAGCPHEITVGLLIALARAVRGD